MKNLIIFVLNFKAGVVKLVDTLDLGSSASRLGGSSPFTRTIISQSPFNKGAYFFEDGILKS